MPDTLPNIPLPTNEWVDLYAASGIAVGTQILVENTAVADVFLAVQAAQPDPEHKSYNILERTGDPLRNTFGDAGAWARCPNQGGEVNVNPVIENGFYPNNQSKIVDSAGVELRLETDGSMPVTIQDQTSPTIFAHLNKVSNTTELTNAVAIDDLTFDVDDATGFDVADFVVITSIADNRFYICNPISFVVNTVTADSPLDFAFPAGSIVTAGTKEMNVNGAVTPQTFSLRAADPGIPLVVDITRLMFECQTENPISLVDFGDIAGGLLNGVVLRRVDGTFQNIVNFKTNSDIKGAMFDFDPLEASKPVQGVNGFVSRWTFAGQNKMGVAIRLGPGEDLEAIIQDDLLTLIKFHIIAEGHVVVD